MGGAEMRPIPGWEDRYAVTSAGCVYSLPRRKSPQLREMAQYTDSTGYPYVSLTKSDRRQRMRVHVLVLLTFVGPRPDGYHCCHCDGDKTNNHVDNLRWDTPASNILDRVRHGTHNNANKTHCPQGHPYSPENTAVSANGHRSCRTCRRKQGREYTQIQNRIYGICPHCGTELSRPSLRMHLWRGSCIAKAAS